MSDKPDPRLIALEDAAYADPGACFCCECKTFAKWLAVMDAADRSAGFVRINRLDDELVVKIAEVIYTELPRLRGVRSLARAVLDMLVAGDDQ